MKVSIVKALLEEKLDELQNRAKAGRGDLVIQPNSDPLDRAKDESSRMSAASLGERDKNLIQAVQEALGRIEEGRYGECARCREEIAPRRLEFVPWAILCVACQEHSERTRFMENEKSVQKLTDHGQAMIAEIQRERHTERI